ncbi:MAG: serine hydrolase domain-containing protein [Crocinitomicaceae bacterium]
MIRIIAIPFLLLIGSASSFGQTYNKIDNRVKLIIDSTYNSLIEKNKVVGTSIAIVKNGEIIYATGYGYQNQESSIKADENTIYRIGSCTKSFTALSVMQLQEQGKLDVNNPIQEYVPQIKIKNRFTEENPILIHSIFNHSSGLPSDIINGFFCDNPPSIDWLIDQLNKCTMAASSGYQHSYSNTGYSLLGKLIEETSGQDYEAYVSDNIFKPLGMTSSYITAPSNLLTQTSKGYMDDKAIDETMIRDAAAGLIHSNVIDMAKYVNMYLADGKSLASAASIDEMEKDGLDKLVLQTSRQWGYGLYGNDISIVTGDDSVKARVIGHGGDTWAFHADFQYIPELNLGAVVLTNTNNGSKIRSAKKLLDLYLKTSSKSTIKVLAKEANPDLPKDLICSPNDIIGQYHLGGITINVENPEKIKFKQGGAKIVMKPMNDSLRYNAKVKLLSIIPIKIKHQEFKFVDYNKEIYMKVIQTRTGNEDYVSKKSERKIIPNDWKNKLGNYTLVGDFYECKDCPYMNFEELGLSLAIKNEILVMKLDGKSKDVERELKFDPISSEIATSYGIGRNSGETLRVLKNGNLFYSGFEFQKLP